MVSDLDYTSPSTQYAFDVNNSPFFKKDNENYINILGIKQLNTLQNVSLLDIFLSTSNIVEPHYHQNAARTGLLYIWCCCCIHAEPLYKTSSQLLYYTWASG